MATAGVGSAPHLYGELFEMMAGVDLVTVNYCGSALALPDLIGGQVQVMFDVVISSIGHIKAGKLRAVGVTTTARLDVLPDVPPIADFVLGYYVSSRGWHWCSDRDVALKLLLSGIEKKLMLLLLI